MAGRAGMGQALLVQQLSVSRVRSLLTVESSLAWLSPLSFPAPKDPLPQTPSPSAREASLILLSLLPGLYPDRRSISRPRPNPTLTEHRAFPDPFP